MSKVGKIERETQNRLVRLFQDELGYRYLGNWEDRSNNSHIEEGILTEYLTRRGYSPVLITKALYQLGKVANDQSKSLYDVNKEVYSLLRYGVNVQAEIGQNRQTVWLIDWQHPEANDFAVAEEVSIQGKHKKRPDLVVYMLKYMTAKIPMGRLGTVDEAAALVCWIVSAEATFNTGFIFDLSGGRATY